MKSLFKKISLLLVITIIFNLSISTFSFATSSKVKDSSVTISNQAEVPKNTEDKIVPQGLAGKALKVILKLLVTGFEKLGKEASKVWTTIESKVYAAIDSAKNLAYDGPGGGERIFQIRDGSKELFRLDAKPSYSTSGKKVLWIHYHCAPDMNNHYGIIEIPYNW